MSNLFQDYQAFTKTTAVYPAARALDYLSLAICDEVGELAEKLLPFVSFTSPMITHKIGPSVIDEAGDVMCYVARMADEMDVPLKWIADNAMYEGEASIPAALIGMVIFASKIAGRRKKAIRDGDTWNETKKVENERAVIDNLCNVVSCLFVIVRFFDSHLEGVMHRNRVKLQDRLDRNVVRGEGDHR